MEQSVNPETSKPIEVSKLHFLIHPGFMADPETDLTNSPISKDSLIILDRYLEHSKTIPDNELVLVFLHATPRELIRDFRQHKIYAEKIRQIKNTLGRRMITFSGDFDLFGEYEDTDPAEEIKQMAKKRGFIFNENVSSEAYGETLGVCVEEGANNLNKVLKLVKKTIVKAELTDLDTEGGLPKENLDKHKDKMRDVFEYIDYE